MRFPPARLSSANSSPPLFLYTGPHPAIAEVPPRYFLLLFHRPQSLLCCGRSAVSATFLPAEELVRLLWLDALSSNTMQPDGCSLFIVLTKRYRKERLAGVRPASDSLVRISKVAFLATQKRRAKIPSAAVQDETQDNTCVRPPLQPHYDDTYKVITRSHKHFVIMMNGCEDSVSIDRLKPAFLDATDTIPPDNKCLQDRSVGFSLEGVPVAIRRGRIGAPTHSPGSLRVHAYRTLAASSVSLGLGSTDVHDRRRERREAAERRAIAAIQQLTDTSSSPAEKAQQNGKYATSGNKTNTRKRPPIPRLPRDDRKNVVRPRNLNLRSISPGTLLATVCAQLNLPMAAIRSEDQLRINPYNNTFTISTPCDERAQLYLNLPGLRIHNVDHPVMAYLPAPDNAVRGVIYGALGNETAEDITQLCILENPNLQILSARRMGLSRAMVITFAGAKLPRIPPTQRCRRCGEEHPPPPQGEAPSCEARCIICDGAHTTGSRNCKQHFVTKPKKALHRSSPLPVTSNRYSALSASHSRDRSASFPPLEESKKVCNTTRGSSGNSNSQGQKQPEKTSSSSSSSSSQKPYKQVSWAARVSHIDARERELLECKTMNKKLLETIAQMHKVMSEMAEKKNPPPKFSPVHRPISPAAAITSHLSTSLPPANAEIINMDTDVNRATQKRQSSESIDTAAKKLAETSSEDEPVPRSKLPVTSKALERIQGRLDKHDHEINDLKVSFNRFAEETIQRFNSIDQRIEQQLQLILQSITPHNPPQHQHGAATSAP
ncbi:hypothetical protein HPB50_021385 [Hyalomma asiaticum]|uniref:Uncharacterized protein n=1 Tax=Hyalomma asiaticum TaxID=266040 RepID=A0ACB7RKY6_HYAAI|nr:hypothetical protein HPB50_021385 [Hyalomma asiaticum]